MFLKDKKFIIVYFALYAKYSNTNALMYKIKNIVYTKGCLLLVDVLYDMLFLSWNNKKKMERIAHRYLQDDALRWVVAIYDRLASYIIFVYIYLYDR
jgi:hypothetical protein